MDLVHCLNHDYCSNAQLLHYVGPLDSALQSRKAFALTAWKQELIVFADSRVEQAAFTLDRYRRAGYAHVLPILDEPEQCTTLLQLFSAGEARSNAHHSRGNISCGYYRTKDEKGTPYVSGFEYLRHRVGSPSWWRKWFTTARAVSLGYNVMSVDADTLPLGDWYGMVKAPPAADYNMISQSECSYCINGGFSYIQNAAPDGPVAWMLYEAMHRVVRWSEDPSALRNLSAAMTPDRGNTQQEDQGMMTDALLSALAGSPIHWMAFTWLDNDKPAWAKLGGEKGFSDHVYGSAIAKLQDRELWAQGWVADRIPDEVYPDSRPPDRSGPRVRVRLRTGILHMPHEAREWSGTRGVRLFGLPGPFTRAYRLAFEDLGVPLPPNPEDPEDEARSNATKTELFALTAVATEKLASGRKRMLGAWLESSWHLYGRLGHWHLHLRPNFSSAMGHVHAGLNPGGTLDVKQVALMHTGHYNWHMASRLYGGTAHVFLATQHERGSVAAASLARVVAYAPGVIHYNLSKPAFVRAAQELARVAAALGAAVAWPAADCSSDWVLNPDYRNLSKPLRHSIPWLHINTVHAVSPFGSSLEELQCEWTGFAHDGCVGRGSRGLLAVELDHLLAHHRGPERHPHTHPHEPEPGRGRQHHHWQGAGHTHMLRQGQVLQRPPLGQRGQERQGQRGRERRRRRLASALEHGQEPGTGKSTGTGTSTGTAAGAGKGARAGAEQATGGHRQGPTAARGGGGHRGMEHTLRLQATTAQPRPRLSSTFVPVSYTDLLTLNHQTLAETEYVHHHQPPAAVSHAHANTTRTAGRAAPPSAWGAVLWLDRLVELRGPLPKHAEEAYQAQHKRCPSLHYFDLPEEQRTLW
ncbi:hypothetical protein HYH03_002041 [Edaphochlamys debaryana]|uniref:Nucleotide-diphospho-sugar transferase domain-containing protein n=1 Tax=Edaphochlamys debaryana TaxID=47281 RepID=A0A835YCP8_9CHLO|nr:hypothetical protein HYH03_002041 [Edaphochlamys debaryana]|eukprot:KAG2500475.1 hypothetical protein HYH03_002041 [Edaphochlamys debaryana]